MSATTERIARARDLARHMPVAYRLARATMRDARHEAADRAKHGLHAAQRAARRTARRAEDAADDAALTIRRHPLRAVTVAFAAGGTLGLLIGALARRPRRTFAR